MGSKEAERYIERHAHSAIDWAEEEMVLMDIDAISAVKIAEQEMKDKSVKIFTEVIEKCFNCEDACLPKCGKDCLIYNFKELLNK